MSAIASGLGCGTTKEGRRPKILTVAAVDAMVWGLLQPWLRGLREAGLEVEVACSRDKYFDLLAKAGFRMHAVPFQRSFNPFKNVVSLFSMWRLLRRERFDLVNFHSPVAAAVGRVGVWLSRWEGPCIYTVHGFYFHDRMTPILRYCFMAIEWVLGRRTSYFMFVSEEDRQTALRAGIARSEARTSTIYNGVDPAVFSPRSTNEEVARKARRELAIPEGRRVVGIVGRIVKEKGYREFLRMAERIVSQRKDVIFLVVGDNLPSDRDQFGVILKRAVAARGLTSHFIFSGLTSNVLAYLHVMDIFVLPSYREGFPRSVLEAMATALPVIASSIRGCREAVVHGETGVLIPPGDADALQRAVTFMLDNPELARRMGEEGRQRVLRFFTAERVTEAFVSTVRRAWEMNAASRCAAKSRA
jgi:glycosyltransferase involved in cell wall biosynthesis